VIRKTLSRRDASDLRDTTGRLRQRPSWTSRDAGSGDDKRHDQGYKTGSNQKQWAPWTQNSFAPLATAQLCYQFI